MLIDSMIYHIYIHVIYSDAQNVLISIPNMVLTSIHETIYRNRAFMVNIHGYLAGTKLAQHILT